METMLLPLADGWQIADLQAQWNVARDTHEQSPVALSMNLRRWTEYLNHLVRHRHYGPNHYPLGETDDTNLAIAFCGVPVRVRESLPDSSVAFEFVWAQEEPVWSERNQRANYERIRREQDEARD